MCALNWENYKLQYIEYSQLTLRGNETFVCMYVRKGIRRYRFEY